MNLENKNPEINQVKSTQLPALSEHTVLRYLAFSALYFAQGIPEGILWFGLPAWMAMAGISPAAIGAYVAVIGIPWSFKILAAPLMDRFTYLPMGRRRPWILFGQLGLMASFLAMAFIPDPMNNLKLLMALGFIVSLCGVFQDIAVDGMAIDIVPTNQQARANGLTWGSKTLVYLPLRLPVLISIIPTVIFMRLHFSRSQCFSLWLCPYFYVKDREKKSCPGPMELPLKFPANFNYTAGLRFSKAYTRLLFCQ
ncbi:MAG: hypothetical protein U5K51_16315 [Flavobacteriaceae bacterium]|nr:hypothetical protein [Flavobacteriaceae bacterium]